MNFFKTLAMVGLVILFGIGCYIAAGINVRRLVNKKIIITTGIISLIIGWTVWASFLLLVLLLFLYLGFKTGQTELYVLTVTKGERPILYWSTTGIMTIAAVVFGFYLLQNLFYHQ